MIFDFELHDILKEIAIENRLKILLFDCSGKYKKLDPNKRARNIYAIDNDSRSVWRIFSDSDERGWPFLDVFLKNGELHAFRWDDCEYSVDIKTGKATALAFLR